jgi:hypothetical protein
MRDVIVSSVVRNQLDELEAYLQNTYKLSPEAASRRMDRIGHRIQSLSNPVDAAFCRFRRWRSLGYRCISFEGWVFAYLVVPEGVIVRDMAHSSVLYDVVN